MVHRDVTGIVLAGGKSSRMGADKALLVWRGKPIIQHAVEILQQVCERVIISANHENYTFTGCETWHDEINLQAPMVGIYSCLKRSEHTWNIVLSCDMPLIDRDLLVMLLSKRRNCDIVLPVHDEDRMEPLCAAYSKRVIPQLEECITNNQLVMRHFILQSRHRRLSIPAENGKIANRYMNINTGDDYHLLSLT